MGPKWPDKLRTDGNDDPFGSVPPTPSSAQKRRRVTPPPLPGSDAGAGTSKQRRLDNTAAPATPFRTPLKNAKSTEEGKAARLKSIESALQAARGKSPASEASGTPTRAGHSVRASPSRSSSIFAQVEAALHNQKAAASDTPPSPSPSPASWSQKQRTASLPPVPLFRSQRQLSTQSSVGTSITSEVEDADLADMEEKGIQTDPLNEEDEEYPDDDCPGYEESVIEGFSPPQSALGSPILASSSTFDDDLVEAELQATFGSGHTGTPGRPPSTPTPGRGGPTHTWAPGGNDGMLLTPPRSSHTAAHAHMHGTPAANDGALDMAPPPTPSPQKAGGGRELARPISSTKAKAKAGPASQWQMIQDDPVRTPRLSPSHHFM